MPLNLNYTYALLPSLLSNGKTNETIHVNDTCVKSTTGLVLDYNEPQCQYANIIDCFC